MLNAKVWFLLISFLFSVDSIQKEDTLCDSGSQPKLTVKIITWNVNERTPPKNLQTLFELSDPQGFLPNLVAVGLQEVNPISNPFSKSTEKSWLSEISDQLEWMGYQKVQERAIHGSLLVIFADTPTYTSLTRVESTSVNRGFAEMGPNKGANAIRFDFDSISICFVSSHLAAHSHALENRIKDYHKIESQLIFDKQGPSMFALEHDIRFWFGDLNFRIDNMTTEEVYYSVMEGDLNSLLANDQLNKVIQDGTAFIGFKEPEIRFNPTFKFNVNSSKYNMKRTPAYTDRILYRNNDPRLCLKNVEYKSNPMFFISDHKPVTATYLICKC